MTGSAINHWVLSQCETLLRNLYNEPRDEEIIGTFLSIMNEPLREATSAPKKKE